MISDDTSRQLVLDDIDPLECNQFQVLKRDGREASFDANRIKVAIEKAFKAEQQLGDEEALAAAAQEQIHRVTETVMKEVVARAVQGERLEIELIQDAVENQLMIEGHFAVARRYILYREERKRMRVLQGEPQPGVEPIKVRKPDGSSEELDPQQIRRTLLKACAGLEDRCDWKSLAEEVLRSIYNGIPAAELENALIMASRSRIEREPAYGFMAARLLMNKIYSEVWQEDVATYDIERTYREQFRSYIQEGVDAELLTPQLLRFDLEAIADGLMVERDYQFNYLGLQTVYDRYLLHIKKRRIETPQYFFMRVAMGLASQEGEQKTERALEFYNLLSSFRFMSSTPTLFNSGTNHPQLSSCYLLTIDDDLGHIFKTISDDAQLSKWAGGLGNDWTNVRATGSYIKGTNGESQGVIPFLKVANDTAVAVNQGGKRKGAMCAYLETWHLDLEDFLELRKNTGDERRRTHDMHTANWIPDLFMKRVREQGEWTLFSPNDVPELHHVFGREFEKRYLEAEAKAESGELTLFKKVEAVTLWRRMLTSLFETGHPWITFKDPSNIRSPQQHSGVVHSSNLCTEILLNTSMDESAVCNLGSVNLVAHIRDGVFDEELVADTVSTAIRMLDNVIDINYYPTEETARSNRKHRPVGLGIMGFQDALYCQGIAYDSDAAVDFADRSMEAVSFNALLASSDLAKERGAYESYHGSLWSQGVLPIDSIELLRKERGGDVTMDTTQRQDWDQVRKNIAQFGLRNSNTMAIAPTATISNITGVSQSIEPAFKQLFVKSNLSGEFTVVNPYLVAELKALGLWDAPMVDDIKYFDGSVQEIERIPEEVRARFKCAFEIDSKWLIESASRRQKWIDMGQSLNLYIAEPSGKKLNEMYMMAWEKGLKTTYYLRATAATTVEKSTLDVNTRGVQPRWMKNASASADIQVDRNQPPPESSGGRGTVPEATVVPEVTVVPEATVVEDLPATMKGHCSIDNPDCEACQ